MPTFYPALPMHEQVIRRKEFNWDEIELKVNNLPTFEINQRWFGRQQLRISSTLELIPDKWFTLQEICKQCNPGKSSTVVRAIESLVKFGYINRKLIPENELGKGPKHPYMYRFVRRPKT